MYRSLISERTIYKTPVNYSYTRDEFTPPHKIFTVDPVQPTFIPSSDYIGTTKSQMNKKINSLLTPLKVYERPIDKDKSRNRRL